MPTYKTKPKPKRKTRRLEATAFDAAKVHPAAMTPQRKYVIKKSTIHGNGAFTSQPIKAKEIIGLSIIMNNEERTITQNFGRLLNHSKKNNAEFIKLNDGHYYVIATKAMPKNTEITVNYDGPDMPIFIAGSNPHYI